MIKNAFIFLAILMSGIARAGQIAVPPAYTAIAKTHGVPPEILFSVCQQESGAKLRSGGRLPWPWSLNIAGTSARYLSRVEAWSALRSALSAGTESVDVGICQVNWKWNGSRFSDAWNALEPYTNIDVAASLLREHFDQRKSWWAAVGAYHSPGSSPEQVARAQNYIALVRRHFDSLGFSAASDVRWTM